MLREAIATGDTVEEALRKACEELEVDSSEVEFEIIQVPVKKTFGLFGGSPAKVRAYIEENERTPAEDAAEYIKTILTYMGVKHPTIEIKQDENGAEMKLDGDDIGFVIGHRGETLDSLQYLSSLVANHVENRYFRITLDIGNYREKRMETLQSLGKKMAAKAVRTGRNASLEPMNPYERSIIHTAVQEVEGAKSWSVGEDMNRHVMIGPVGGERYQKRDNRGRGSTNNRRYNNDRGGDRSQYNRFQNRSRPSNKGNQPDQNRNPAKRDDPNAPIYGRIEKKK